MPPGCFRLTDDERRMVSAHLRRRRLLPVEEDLTIAYLVGEAETPTYIEALKDKRLRKEYPMWAIEDAGDERATGPVADYVVGTLRKARRSKRGHLGDAYVGGLRFLAGYRRSRPELAEV